MTVTFTVDRPLSVNRMYARGRGRRLFLTAEGRAFKERLRAHAIAAAAQQNWPKDLWQITRVELSYKLEGYRGDTDGPRKPVRDALEGILYINDRIVQDGPAPLPTAAKESRMHISVTILEMRSADDARIARVKWEKARDARLRAKAKKRSAA